MASLALCCTLLVLLIQLYQVQGNAILHETRDEAAPLLFCGFDDADERCPVMRVHSRDQEWAVIGEGTTSQEPGPSGGYDGSDGYMKYQATCENAGDTARFSLVGVDKPRACVRVEFYYQMDGQNMGTFNIYTFQNFNKVTYVTLSDATGDQWTRVSFTAIFSDVSTQLVYETVRGQGCVGYIAIDSISLTEC